jgi:ABC-type amino acid transport substrate-binding protein
MQLFSFLVLIFGITVSASLFSMTTAALTQSVSPKKDFSVATMDQYHVATLRGSTAHGYLAESKKQPFSLELSDTWRNALEKVANGEKDLVLGDWVQLVYLSQRPELRDKITVHSQSFKFEPYGWGLTTNHPIKDRVNQELIGLLRSPLGSDIVKHYIGDQQISMQVN